MARAHHCPAHWPQGEACWPTAIVLHAALKRADELNRLRDLPDTPTRSEVEDTTPKVAGLPSNRSDSDPEEAATINETPVVSIPIEIGEPAAVEMPLSLIHI